MAEISMLAWRSKSLLGGSSSAALCAGSGINKPVGRQRGGMAWRHQRRHRSIVKRQHQQSACGGSETWQQRRRGSGGDDEENSENAKASWRAKAAWRAVMLAYRNLIVTVK